MKEETKKILSEKLQKGCISQRSKGGTTLSYIESHHAIREANRAFGFDGWDYEINELTMVSDEKNANGNHVIGYIARVIVSVGCTTREDVGFGSGIAKGLADAHEGATKEAVSDAMKRALRTFGDIFGLALYDKKQEHVDDGNNISKEVLLSHLPSCKTVKQLEAYLNKKENKHFVNNSPDKEEIIKAFGKRKEEIVNLGGDSQGQRN